MAGDNFNWTRNQGGTVSRGTGPGIDHTLGTCKYRTEVKHGCAGSHDMMTSVNDANLIHKCFIDVAGWCCYR